MSEGYASPVACVGLVALVLFPALGAAAERELTPLETDTFRIVASYEPPEKERSTSPRVFLALQHDGVYFERYRTRCARAKRRSPPPNCPAQNDRRGTWKLVHRANGQFIRFDRGPLVRYRFEGIVLKLRAPRGRKWEALLPTEGVRCLDTNDCGRFNIMHPECVGAWTCSRNECRWICGRHESPEGLIR